MKLQENEAKEVFQYYTFFYKKPITLRIGSTLKLKILGSKVSGIHSNFMHNFLNYFV